MVIFLFSERKFEQQAISCIRSLNKVISDDIKIVYFTIGFNSAFHQKNLHKSYVDVNEDFQKFTYYKPDLSLRVMNMFPDEQYIYTDADVLFSPRFFIDKVINKDLNYPLASFGIYEYPNIFETTNGITVYFSERKLMDYFNVPVRTMRYVWACFFSFNSNCRDFIEEWSSMCSNKYIYKDRKSYFPFHDETSFNVCLWKRKSTKSLGYAFINTHLLEVVRNSENNINLRLDFNTGEMAENNKNILFYHGFNDQAEMNASLDYLLKL